ncbi:hypothetical protein HDU86_008466 [Geranomyces michiganensis]|nr:hypothetical protein HDU86_008466 [Geranomyces michiganensis]
MSTFDGRIREYPSIAADYFHATRSNLRVFLLSHVHADHLNGLSSTSFNLPLYCSEESARLLLRLQHRRRVATTAAAAPAAAPPEPYVPSYRYTHLKPYLRPLRYEEPQQVYVGDGQTVTLTLLNANHCVGSAMFLIEGENGNVLYTGDMRAEAWFVRGVADYVDQGIIPDDLATVYLDTTFCHEDYASFPTRAESIEHIIRIIRQYDAGMTFKFGYNILGIEPLWERIASVFNAKIFLHPGKFALYSNLPNPPPYITNDPTCTRFHASGAGPFPDERTVVIRPSTMRWRDTLQDAGRGLLADGDADAALPVVESQERVWNVLYSIHSSLGELQDLVMVLQPLAVFPCVLGKERFESRRIGELFTPYLRRPPPPVERHCLPAVALVQPPPPPLLPANLVVVEVIESSQGDTEPIDSSLPTISDGEILVSEQPDDGNADEENESPSCVSYTAELSASYSDDGSCGIGIQLSFSPQLLPQGPLRSPATHSSPLLTMDSVSPLKLPRVVVSGPAKGLLAPSSSSLASDITDVIVIHSHSSQESNLAADAADGSHPAGAGADDDVVIIIAEAPPPPVTTTTTTTHNSTFFHHPCSTLVHEPSDMRSTTPQQYPQETTSSATSASTVRSATATNAAPAACRRSQGLKRRSLSSSVAELPDWIPDRSRRRRKTSSDAVEMEGWTVGPSSSVAVIDLTVD